jgi:hypothetical protein
MSVATPLTGRRMSLRRVEFAELYARHLCRHSQFGINVVHLAAVFGTWTAIYGILAWLAGTIYAPIGLAAGHLALIAFNVPARLVLVSGLSFALMIAVVFLLPGIPVWVYALTIPVWYKIQAYSHKVWNIEKDMSEFNKKYEKGPLLFVILTIYETPILLNYLMFDRKSGSA